MNYRPLGKTGFKVSEVSLGTWQLGADWGNIEKDKAFEILRTAVDNGVNFFDTADVYGDGRSEQIIGEFLKRTKPKMIVATKAGRRLKPHTAEGYTKSNIKKFIERSLKNLQKDSLDLLQLHCPPTSVYYKPEVFAALDEFKSQGLIKHYGVSVEKIEEAIKAMQYPGVETVQIIFNIFRQRPNELFFDLARKNKIGIISRVPLASGLLTGKFNKSTQFAKTDHRNYNRKGSAFDVGETFAGVDFSTGLAAVEELKKMKPAVYSMPQFAIRWILDHKEVSCVITGASKPEHIIDNAQASRLKPLNKTNANKIKKLYEAKIKASVHQRW